MSESGPSTAEMSPEEFDARIKTILRGMGACSGPAQQLAYLQNELRKVPQADMPAIVTAVLAPRLDKELAVKPKPDLTDSFIILLISAAITIFLFWISSQYLGQENFARLPDWIVGTYKGIWSSVAAGGVGIGAALFKAFTNRGRPQPHYLLYIGATTGCLLIPIALIVALPAIFPQLQGRKQMQPPAGVARITLGATGSTDFDLEAEPQTVPVTYILRGSFTVDEGTLKGHLASGKVKVAEELPKSFPEAITRISFRTCYLGSVNGVEQMMIYPENPKARDSIEVNLALTAGASYDLSPGDFAFDLPGAKSLDRAWLCAALWNGIGYFPAQ
jgi:hypothetical protein